MKTLTYASLCLIILSTLSCNNTNQTKVHSPKETDAKEVNQRISSLLLDLPETFNSPASGTIDNKGNIYFTSPNFHNDVLIASGEMTQPSLPTIGKIDKNNQLTTWYTFKPEDMDKTSGKIAPFGITFGPDNHLYVVDMQKWFGGESRILRFKLIEGKIIDLETVAKGFSFPNALVWKGNDLFISDTDLGLTENGKQLSGVYKINLTELNQEIPVQIHKYKNEIDNDSHLFETFVSDASLKFGANGIAFDGNGNLYTGIMEEGSVYKTTLNENNEKIETKLFVTGMIATDGLKWDAKTNKLFITDLFANAVYSIDMKGQLELLVSNENTNGKDGKLDAPSEVIVRGDEVIVLNFDAVFDHPKMINKKADKPYTISTFKL